MPAKLFEAGDLKGQMRQIRRDADRTAGGKTADFDELRAFRGFQENQFRTAR